MEVKAIPVICDHAPAQGIVLGTMKVEGKVLQIRELGAEYDGWSVSWPQLILALQDAARGARYVKDGAR